MTERRDAVLVAGALLQCLTEHGLITEDHRWSLTREPHSPWLLVDVEEHGQFAVWRNTGDIYIVDVDGSVGDDPISLKDKDG